MKPTLNSPKNKYRASLTFSKALPELGSIKTVHGMTVGCIKSNYSYLIEQAIKAKASVLVVIYENKQLYPLFDWVEVDSYTIK
jgi:hypothetical protein